MNCQRRILTSDGAGGSILEFAGTGGSIAGTVADPSGAVMPEMIVAARNVDTGVVQKTTTNADGFYAFPALAEGGYELRIEHSGFQPYKSAAALVSSNAALRIAIQLALETHGETVTVIESPTHVETTNTQMGALICAKQVASVPINGRSYTDLQALQPGVIPASSQQRNSMVMAGCTSAPPSGDLNPGNRATMLKALDVLDPVRVVHDSKEATR